MKEESEKGGLKLNIQKSKIMASVLITSCQLDGGNVETVSDFIFLWTVSDFVFFYSKVNADGDCSHEIKRCLLLRILAMANLESILKSRDITLLTKVHVVKAMAFPVVVYGCQLDHKQGRATKTDAFELWCWRRLLRVPWIAGRSNQSILKEISPGCS